MYLYLHTALKVTINIEHENLDIPMVSSGILIQGTLFIFLVGGGRGGRLMRYLRCRADLLVGVLLKLALSSVNDTLSYCVWSM